MGHLDQLAKLTFAEETEAITGGAVTWMPGPELGLTEVRLDGLFVVKNPALLASLAWPWPAAEGHDEIVLEQKMPGDHLDDRAQERALLRRQARQVQRLEAEVPGQPRWHGQQPLWMSAPVLSENLSGLRQVRRAAPGCYFIEPSPFVWLWIAANELPLCEELIPFLIGRSGRALVEFARWIVTRRPASWVLRMLEIVPMPLSVREEFERYLAPVPRDDPEIRQRGRDLTEMMLRHFPEVRDELIEAGIETGIEKGIERGIEKGLMPLLHLFERRLGRALTPEEHHGLRERFDRLGSTRLGDVVLDLSAEALAAWLADPDAA
jgi:hypothetical protein